jgi:ATP-binding cassette, subfamily B, bacterial
MSKALSTLTAAVRLAWRAGRAQVLAMVVLALAAAAAPVTLAWYTKLVFDRLAAPGSSAAALLPLVVGLGVTGMVAAALPQLGQYLRSELQRRRPYR